MLAPLCLLIVLGLTLFDQGPVGTVLRLWLVERPASILSRLTRGQILGVILVIGLGAAAVALFEAAGVRLFAMAAPDLIAWVLMFDVTVLFDLAILALSLRAVAGWRGLVRAGEAVRAQTRLAVQRLRSRTRARRVRRLRPPRPRSPDDEPQGAWTFGLSPA